MIHRGIDPVAWEAFSAATSIRRSWGRAPA